MSATPRPWHTSKDARRMVRIRGADAFPVATYLLLDDAELIVRAVNLHAEMLSLLRRWNRCYPANISPWPGISEETEALLARIDDDLLAKMDASETGGIAY